MRERPHFRFSVQAKVLAPVLTLLLLLPLTTVLVVDRNVTDQALDEARKNLITSDAVFRNSLEIHARNLTARFASVVKEPRYRATAGLADAGNYRLLLRDALDEHAADADVMVMTTADGAVSETETRAGIHVDEAALARATHAAVEAAAGGNTVSAIAVLENQIYNIACVPVTRDDRSDPLAVLTVGSRLGEREADELRKLTRAEIILLADDRVAVSTLTRHTFGDHLQLPPADSAAADPAQSTQRIVIDGEHYLGISQSYAPTGGDGTGFRYVLLASYEARLRTLARTRAWLLGLSGLGILVSGLLAGMLVHRITRPLRDLRDGAEAVGRGDFTRTIRRYSDDECGDLATSFNQMTGNLQASRAELERTVSTLRETQGRLLQREQSLRESEEGLRLIIESARDHAIITLDNHGRVLRWNPAAERIYGYTATEAQGLDYARLFDPQDPGAEAPQDALTATGREGRHSFECRRVRKDGTSFWADVTLSALPAGGAAGFVEIARDITVRKQAEQALREARDAAETASRSKTEFLANMTHELRTPMNAIIGMSSLLIDQPDPAETRECATTIRSSARALLDIIDDILALSQIEAGELAIAHEPVDVVGCLEQELDHYAARAAQKGLELGLCVARETPGIVHGDAVRLRQVLGCLINNAIKFTERGGITVHVAPAALPCGANGVRFSVRDTGVGIPTTHVERLFQPFSQGDSTRTRRHGGTGLGLALSRRLVELMGGTICVTSEPGRGSCFTFTIAAQIEPAPPEFGGLAGMRVALAVHSPLLRQLLRDQLLAWDVRPVDEDSALPPDIAIVDHPASTSRGARVIVLNPFASHDASNGLMRTLKPRALHAALRRGGRAASPPVSGPDFAAAHPLRVLLVEDNPINAILATKMLSRFGYAADHAENGRLALEALQNKAYDLVLMDLQMPELDGLDTTRAIRAAIPATHPPYIVALTANARPEDREACMAAGMHGFMAKPLQMPSLGGTLEQAHAWLVQSGQTSSVLRFPTSTAS